MAVTGESAPVSPVTRFGQSSPAAGGLQTALSEQSPRQVHGASLMHKVVCFSKCVGEPLTCFKGPPGAI